jgi:hypothetical protein
MEEMMASDVKKSKVDPAPAKEAAPKKEAVAADKSTPDAIPAKAEGGESPAASYSRGEGQKAVTKAYKDNWNLIFGTKETAKKPKKRTQKKTRTIAKKKAKKVTKKKAKKAKKKR